MSKEAEPIPETALEPALDQEPESGSESGPELGPELGPQKAVGRSRRRVWRLAAQVVRLVLLIILFGGAFVYLGLSLTERQIIAPDWLAQRLEQRIKAGAPKGRISVGRLKFRVDTGLAPRIIMTNVGIFDDRSVEIVRLNNVEARLAPTALLGGKVQIDLVRLSGAQVTLRRRADGQLDLSFGEEEVTSGTLPGVLDTLDELFEQPGMRELKQLSADDLTIALEDARSGRLWQITDGSASVRHGDNGLDITIGFDVFNGTEELAETVIGIRTDKGSSAAAIGTTFSNAAAADIALQSPALSFLGVLDAPISGALRAQFGTGGTLETLAGTLEIGEGALRPGEGVDPLHFADAKAYFEFDPAQQKLAFSEIRLQSDTASVIARGQAFMREFEGGWPSVFLGQFALSDIKVHPRQYYQQPITFSEGAADFRVRLSPFSIELGQFVLLNGDERMTAKGQAEARDDGWQLAVDVSANSLADDRLLALWPVSIVPKTRKWLSDNILSARLSDVKGAIRLSPDHAPHMSVGWNFSDTSVRYIRTQPDIENASGYAVIDGTTFTLNIDQGTVAAPLGGLIDMAGSSFQIADITRKPARATVRLAGKSTTTAILSLLDAPPFRILRRSGFGPDVADGKARFRATVDFDLKKKIQIEDVRFSVHGDLLDVRSDILVPGRALSADRLELRADNDQVEISGPVQLGRVAADATWRQPLGREQAGKSTVSGQVELGRDFVQEFRIGLPDDMVSGRAQARFHLDLARGSAPQFTLQSDLNRLALKVSALGWSKPANSTGRLEVRGRLGKDVGIDLLEIVAPGLSATGGSVSLRGDGGLGVLAFKRLRVGGWLDAPVTLEGRGAGLMPLVRTNGGSIDVRKTSFAGRGGAGGTRSQTGGPVILNLDRVIISDGMMLTGFSGDFDTTGGFKGNFKARMNGGAPLAGELAPVASGTLIRIGSNNAGGVLRSAGIVEYANKGRMDLTLRPLAAAGEYAGNLNIRNIKVKNAPGLTDLLAALSIVGLLEQLSGEGINFDDVSARFRLTPTAVILQESSAVGPSLGLSLDGVYDLRRGTMDMRGVISPVFFLNGIGQVVSRRGEGLFGFSFTLAGTNASPTVKVNPLSILTPGALREIFRGKAPTAPANGG